MHIVFLLLIIGLILKILSYFNIAFDCKLTFLLLYIEKKF